MCHYSTFPQDTTKHSIKRTPLSCFRTTQGVGDHPESGGYDFHMTTRTPLFCVVVCSHSNKLAIRQLHCRSLSCVVLAWLSRRPLSEPGHPSTRDQVMLKGHELHPGHCGTHSSPPETRSQYVDVSLGVLCTPSFIYEWTSRACPFTNYGGNSRCPFINKGVVFLFR